MIVYLIQNKNTVIVRPQLVGDNSFGDLTTVIKTGGNFLGYSYDELINMGNGEHDLKPKNKTKSLPVNTPDVGSQLTNPPFIEDLIRLAFQFVYDDRVDRDTFHKIACDGLTHNKIKLPLSKWDKPMSVVQYVMNHLEDTGELD